MCLSLCATPARKGPGGWRERDSLSNELALAAWLYSLEARYTIYREKSAQCHKGIALSLIVTIDERRKNLCETLAPLRSPALFSSNSVFVPSTTCKVEVCCTFTIPFARVFPNVHNLSRDFHPLLPASPSPSFSHQTAPAPSSFSPSLPTSWLIVA